MNRWKREYLAQLDAAHAGVGQSPSELAAENKRLYKELAQEREIITILKNDQKRELSRVEKLKMIQQNEANTPSKTSASTAGSPRTRTITGKNPAA